MVEPKRTFFEMQVEGFWPHSMKTNQAGFSKSPEAFNTFDVSTSFYGFITAMIDA